MTLESKVDLLIESTDEQTAASQALAQEVAGTMGAINKTIDDKITEVDQRTNQAVADMNALAQPKIDELTQLIASEDLHMASENDMEAMRAEVNRMTAASGMMYMGENSADSAHTNINNGLYVRSVGASNSNANTLYLGRGLGSTGESKTNFPVLAIAGFISEILGVCSASKHDLNETKLPTAPVDGTCTFDSATDVSMDFKTDVDPKYGDVPTGTAEKIRKEACNRAFEGDVKNGDFRNGASDWSTDSGRGLLSVSDGVATLTNTTTTGNSNYIAQSSLINGSDYIVEIGIKSVSANGNWRFSTSGFLPQNSSESGNFTFEFTAASTSFNLYCDDSGQGDGEIEITHLFIRKKTNKVVTAPVDMWGFEGSLQAVTKANPFIYLNGLPQSLATTMDGVATKRSNRPNSYYAWFEGDEDSAGLGCDFYDQSVSVLQRDLWLSNPKNHLYRMKDGTIAQWRVKGRSFRGLGNGDWGSIDSTKPNWFKFGNNDKGRISAQGSRDSDKGFNDSGTDDNFCTYESNYLDTFWKDESPSKGLMHIYRHDNSRIAVNGLCYFLVCGTVPRLSQSMYVEGLNENGTMKAADGKFWYDTTETFLTVADCFNPDKLLAGSGSIASGKSGRPDGRYFDAVYSGGLGGVIDERKSAWGVTPDERARKLRMVEDGTYRGKEKRKFTKPYACNVVSVTQSGGYIFVGITQDDTIPDFGVNKSTIHNGSYVIGDSGTVYKVSRQRPDGILLSTEYGTTPSADFTVGTDCSLVVTTEINISVSGEFLQKEVIGSIESIRANPYLKNGGYWIWNPVIPNGSSQVYNLGKKAISYVDNAFTTDDGLTWSKNGIVNFSFDDNTINRGQPANEVMIVHYTAFASQTKKSTSKAIKADSVGKVLVTDSHERDEAVLLHESLMDQVGTGGNFMSYSVLAEQIKSVIKVTEHVPIKLTGSTSPAVKVQPYFFSENGQENIGFIANEMKWDSGKDAASEATDISVNTNTLYIKDVLYVLSHDDFGHMRNKILRCVNNTGNWGASQVASLIELSSGRFGNDAGAYFKIWDGLGFGDSSAMSVGNGTYTNDNGDVCRSEIHELTMSIGWSINHV